MNHSLREILTFNSVKRNLMQINYVNGFLFFKFNFVHKKSSVCRHILLLNVMVLPHCLVIELFLDVKTVSSSIGTKHKINNSTLSFS